MQSNVATSAMRAGSPVRAMISTIALAALAGCASAPLPINYAPSSVKTATGSLSVSDFNYLPAETGEKPIPPNLIKNTAMGRITIDRDVKVLIRDAVFSELRFVGIKTDDNHRALRGEIEEFLVDDLGYSVDWTLRVKYFITDVASRKVLFESVKNTQRNTAKFANPFGALNETIKLNVESLIEDPEFIKAIN